MNLLNKLFKPKKTNTCKDRIETELDKKEAFSKEKEIATKNKQPWVAVLDTHINEDNIKNGFFELDWNNEFIEVLIDAGYTGETNEQIVEKWFKDIILQILEETNQSSDRNIGSLNISSIL